MSRFFLQYWDRRTWRINTLNKRLLGRTRLWHSGSDEFARKGIKAGDWVYIVTIVGERLYLGGRIHVAGLVDRDTAVRRLGKENLMDKDWHVVAHDADASPFFPNLPVADTIIRRLRWRSMDGLSDLRSLNGRLSPAHGIPGIRQLAPESANLLDAVYEEAWAAPCTDLDRAPPGLFQ